VRGRTRDQDTKLAGARSGSSTATPRVPQTTVAPAAGNRATRDLLVNAPSPELVAWMNTPYVPGPQAATHQSLDGGGRAAVNRAVDQSFAEATGVRRPLTPEPGDRQLVRVWLRLRDRVIEDRYGGAAIETTSTGAPHAPRVGERAEDLESVAGADVCPPPDQLIRWMHRHYLTPIRIKQQEVWSHYRHFSELNLDQPVVSWIVHVVARRPEGLPDTGPLFAGDRAVAALETAIASGDPTKAYAQVARTEAAVNDAVNIMRAYRDSLITAGGTTIRGLTVTRNVGYVAMGVLVTKAAAVYGAGTVTKAALAAATQTATFRTAEQVGRTVAGENVTPEDWLVEVGLGTLTSGAAAAMGASAGQLIKPLAPRLLDMLPKNHPLASMPRDRALALITNVLSGTAKDLVKGATEDALNTALSLVGVGDGVTFEEFLDNVIANLLVGGIAEHVQQEMAADVGKEAAQFVVGVSSSAAKESVPKLAGD
jgi:hypothetical protein